MSLWLQEIGDVKTRISYGVMGVNSLIAFRIVMLYMCYGQLEGEHCVGTEHLYIICDGN